MKDSTWYGRGLFVGTGLLLGFGFFGLSGFVAWFSFLLTIFWIHK